MLVEKKKGEKDYAWFYHGGPWSETRVTGQLSPLSTRASRIYTSAKSVTRATELPVAHCAPVTSLPQFANRRCRNPPATLVYREISELRGRVHTYTRRTRFDGASFRGTNEIYAVSGTRNLRGWKVVGWWSLLQRHESFRWLHRIVIKFNTCNE